MELINTGKLKQVPRVVHHNVCSEVFRLRISLSINLERVVWIISKQEENSDNIMRVIDKIKLKFQAGIEYNINRIPCRVTN